MKPAIVPTNTYCKAYQDETAVKRYEEEIYGEGGHDDILWQVEKQLLKRLVQRNRPHQSGIHAMDFACGTGRVTKFLSEDIDLNLSDLVGVDISPSMLNQARKKCQGVQFTCANIVENPDAVPGEKDLITAFRFLLLAEPPLRLAVSRQLAKKLRDQDSILIFSLHGNPLSYRLLANLRNRLFNRAARRLPSFGMADMRVFAAQAGIRIVGATGAGFLPHTVARILPRKWFAWIEGLMGGWPLIWRFGSNLLVVCKRV